MNETDKYIIAHPDGPLRVANGKGFSHAFVDAVTNMVCNASMRGARLTIPGIAGTADRHVVCDKNAANAYGWREEGQTALDGRYVQGQSSSVDGEIALFSSTTGKLIKRATGTGYVKATSGVYSTSTTIPSTDITGLGLVWLATNSPSGASSSSFDGKFTSTYANYLLVGNLSMSATNASLSLRLRVSSSDSSSALYYYNHWAIDSGGASGAIGGATQTSWSLLPAGGVGVTMTDALFSIVIGNPQATDETTLHGAIEGRFSTPIANGRQLLGFYNATTSYDGLSVLPSTGNISGTLRLFGIRDS